MSALEGVRIIDLSQMIGAPYCTQVLADLGADVIKVEEPTTALLTRVALSPPGADESRRFSGYWLATNRNKRSLTLDLRHPDGKQVLSELVAEADVVVENFGARARRSLGLDESWGFACRPDLVWASLTGYGRTGPEAERDGWDLVAQAAWWSPRHHGRAGRSADEDGQLECRLPRRGAPRGGHPCRPASSATRLMKGS